MRFQNDNSPEVPSEPASASPGPLDEQLIRVTHELRELANDHLELAALETRLAISAALRMGIIAIVTAILFVSAWLGLAGSAALGLIALGAAPALAVLLVAAVNLLLAVLGWRRIRHKLQSIGWPATQRMVKPPSEAEQKDDST